MHMDAQPNRSGRRRRRKKNPTPKTPAAEPVFIAARRPGSPRLEKPTRRMKAASARPRTREEVGSAALSTATPLEPQPAKRREARIVQRKTDEIDEQEKNRRRLFSQFMASEGRAAITRAADTYLTAGFTLPREQDAQLKLLEHFNELRAHEALVVLSELVREETPRQLPVFRQRLRRLEDHAEDPRTREAAADLRRALPA